MIKLVTMKFFLCVCVFLTTVYSQKMEEKTAIVLASFGTTYPEALRSIVSIGEKVKAAFPQYEFRHAFTSNMIRAKWQQRQSDQEYIAKNKGIAQEFLFIKTPLATIADLQDKGFKTIYVQPTHIFAGESFYDLESYINGLNSINTLKKKYKPFKKLVIGRPALGKPGISPSYHDDLNTAAQALKKDIDYAAQKKAALVYVGHGNEYFSSGIFMELQELLCELYPSVQTYIGTVEGYPSVDHIMKRLKKDKIKRVVLKPLMIVAGDHSLNDLAGDGPDSWKTKISKIKIDVECINEGLGENNQFAEIFVSHIRDLTK